MTQVNPYESPKSHAKESRGLLGFVVVNDVIETAAVAGILALFTSAIAPITASAGVAPWNQLPNVFLLPTPGDVGWILYWVLCLVWCIPVALIAFAIESVVVLATNRFVPVRHVHSIMRPLLGVCGFFLGACYHGGLPR